MVNHFGGAVTPHNWKITPQEAIAIQNELRHQVIRADRFEKVRTVAGVDVGFEEKGKITRAAVAVLGFPELEIIDSVIARLPTTFPYVPGLLSFREVPAILEALSRVARPPDMLLCDGHGLAHPRRFGLACHLGLLSGLPSIGVAKSRLIGEHEPLGEMRGDWVPLVDRGEVVGALLRTRSGVKPVYVSVGHRVSLESALEYVLCCAPKYRLPETTRLAHHLASRE